MKTIYRMNLRMTKKEYLKIAKKHNVTGWQERNRATILANEETMRKIVSGLSDKFSRKIEVCPDSVSCETYNSLFNGILCF